MALPSIFRLPQNNTFNYIPIYYDKDKEAMQERLMKYGGTAEEEKINDEEKVNEIKEYKPDIRGKFKSSLSGTGSFYNYQKRTSNIRLLVLIGFFSFIAYYLFKNQDIISLMFNALIKK